MLDDFRQQANEGSLFEDDDPLEIEDLGEFEEEDEDYADETVKPARRKKAAFLGLTAQQRFILAAMLFVLVSVFSVLILLVTGRLVV